MEGDRNWEREDAGRNFVCDEFRLIDFEPQQHFKRGNSAEGLPEVELVESTSLGDDAIQKPPYSPDVERLYLTLFKRSPDVGAKWADDQLNVGIPYREVVRAAITAGGPNSEFRKSIPTDESQIVPFLAERVFGRTEPLTPQELAAWNHVLKTQGVDALIDLFLSYPEFSVRFPARRAVDVDAAMQYYNCLPPEHRTGYLIGLLETSPEKLYALLASMEAKGQPVGPAIESMKSTLRDRFQKGDALAVDLFVRLSPYWNSQDTQNLVNALRSGVLKDIDLPGIIEKNSTVIPYAMRVELVDRIFSAQFASDIIMSRNLRLEGLKIIALFPEVLSTQQVVCIAGLAEFPDVSQRILCNKILSNIVNCSDSPHCRESWWSARRGQQAEEVAEEWRREEKRCKDISIPNAFNPTLFKDWYDECFKKRDAEETFDQRRKIAEAGLAKTGIRETSAYESFAQAGFGDLNLNAKGAKEVFERLEARYGKEKLATISANVDMVNNLPPAVRAIAMGWNHLPDKDRENLGWKAEPNADEKARLSWASMSELQKEQWRWKDCRVKAEDVLLTLSGPANFDQSRYGILANGKELESRIDAGLNFWHCTTNPDRLAVLKASLDDKIKKLANSTEEGSFAAKTDDFFSQNNLLDAWNGGKDKGLERYQKRLRDSIFETTALVKKQESANSELANVKLAVSFARDVKQYKELLLIGDKEAAAKVGLRMAGRYGIGLKTLAPDIWADLTQPGRLVESGSLLHDGLPGLSVHGKEIITYPPEGIDGFNQAMGLHKNSSGEAFGLIHLQRNKADFDFWKAHALARIDSDPAIVGANSKMQHCLGNLEQLSKLLNAAQGGSVYDEYIAHCKTLSGDLRATLAQFTPEELQELRVRAAELKKAREQASDPEIQKELDNRIRDLDKLIHFIVVEKPKLEAMLNDVDKLSESTFGEWVAQNLPVLVAVIAAGTITVVSFGTLSLPALALVSAVVGLGAREITTELLYERNKDGYKGLGERWSKGSVAGNWWRNRDVQKSDSELFNDCLDKVLLPYTIEIVRDTALFMVGAGVGRLGGVLGAPLRQTSAAASTSVLKVAGKELFMNTAFTGVQLVAETAVAEYVAPETFKSEEAKTVLSHGMGLGIAFGQGVLHGRVANPVKLGPKGPTPEIPGGGKSVKPNSTIDPIAPKPSTEVPQRKPEAPQSKPNAPQGNPEAPAKAKADSPDSIADITLHGSGVTNHDVPLGTVRLSAGNSYFDMPAGQERTIRIGRSPDNDLVVSDPTEAVSRNHLTVRTTETGATFIKDNGSKNGTFVNGVRLTAGAEVLLRPGDRVTIGGKQHVPLQLRSARDTNDATSAVQTYPKEVTPSPDAVNASNKYATENMVTWPLPEGFRTAGKNNVFDATGKARGASADDRMVVVVDASRDPILRAAIDEARIKFKHLQNDPVRLAEALNKYVGDLLTPPGMKPRSVDEVTSQLERTHAGKQIMLGEFIRLGTGVCRHQSLVLGELFNAFNLPCSMVRGHGGAHAWVVLHGSGGDHVCDPRNQFVARASMLPEWKPLAPKPVRAKSDTTQIHGVDSQTPGTAGREVTPKAYEKAIPNARPESRSPGSIDQAKPVADLNKSSIKPEPLSPKMKKWFEHDQQSLKMDAEELAALQSAVDSGQLEFRTVDRDFLRSSTMSSREAGPRPSTQSELPRDLANYDPLKSKGPVLVVYDPQTYQYHVINGNNRIMRFGSKEGNPQNLGVPAWLFKSPEAFKAVFGTDPRPMRGTPFKFE